MSKIIAPDVPQALIDLANSINYAAVSPSMLSVKIRELDEAAKKACQQFPDLLKKRNVPFTPSGAKSNHKVKTVVPQQLLDVFNKYDFSGFNKAGMIKKQSIILAFRLYVNNNLPTV